ncbi:MAG: anthranilate phosphoribosyltransferase [Candidatus Omnitrophota bacterium]|jgi:anthranilate phosphoribosyltransferase
MNIEQAIKRLKTYPLNSQETESVMEQIMTGQIETPLIVSFLIALNEQGIDSEELAGAARVMRKHMEKIDPKNHTIILDTCGTGGDRKHTFNISTAAALVAAGVGIAVAKHGNRSITSQCGSADLLKELGVNTEMSPEVAQKCLDEIDITFLFAPIYHPAMKFVMEARKQIAEEKREKTIFNFLGPLCNPARANYQLIGVPDSGYAQSMANALTKLNDPECAHALIVSGEDHMDEITTRVAAKTLVYEVRDGKVVDPKGSRVDFAADFKKIPPGGVKGGSPKENAKIMQAILRDKEKNAYRDIVVLNAAAAIYVADKTRGKTLEKGISEGIKLANKSIDDGKAWDKLKRLQEYSHNG